MLRTVEVIQVCVVLSLGLNPFLTPISLYSWLRICSDLCLAHRPSFLLIYPTTISPTRLQRVYHPFLGACIKVLGWRSWGWILGGGFDLWIWVALKGVLLCIKWVLVLGEGAFGFLICWVLLFSLPITDGCWLIIFPVRSFNFGYPLASSDGWILVLQWLGHIC